VAVRRDKHGCGGFELTVGQDLRRNVEAGHRRLAGVVAHGHQERRGVAEARAHLADLVDQQLYPVGELLARVGQRVGAVLQFGQLALNAIRLVQPELSRRLGGILELLAKLGDSAVYRLGGLGGLQLLRQIGKRSKRTVVMGRDQTL
jgi:hypothetical protein